MSVSVFTYGSNMSSARFRDYGVTPVTSGRAALLRGYQLLFNKWSSKDSSGKANVEPEAGAEVWGVVYSIADAELEVLDRGEGPGYTRKLLPVATSGGSSAEAWVYYSTEVAKRPGLRPYTWYKDFLVIGAKEHGLPAAYVATLERIPADEDPDRARDAERRELNRRGQLDL